MTYVETKCSGALSRFVACTWAISDVPSGAMIHPDGYADLIVDATGRVYLAGVTNRSRRIDTELQQPLKGLRLKAGAIPTFFSASAADFLNQVVSVDETNSSVGRALSLIAREAQHQTALFAAVVETLTKVSQSATPRLHLPPHAVMANEALRHSNSKVSDVSERQLRRICLQEVGISTTRLRRIRRLQGLIDAMRRVPQHLELTDLALGAGFFDQSHMNREVKDITGLTPTLLYRSIAQS